MNITIDDVARMADVSKATVSAVLNDRPGISSVTREKVLHIVRKLNYRPNQIARSLSIRKTKSIGIVIKEIDNPFYAKVMKGVFDKCSDSGYTVLLGSSELTPAQEIKSIDTLINQRVDGLIISPLQGAEYDFSYLADLIKNRYPVVTLGSIINYQTNVVEIDNVKAAYQAVSYLIKQKHSRIAYFAGPPLSAHSFDRLEGYKNALIENNLPVEDNLVVSAGSYIEDGSRAGKMFFPGFSNSPSAVFCFNDLVAIGLIDSLLEMGIRVPEHVSVIGFDDIEFCKSVKIPLTTIRVPAHKIGETAVDLVIQQINSGSEPFNKRIILDAELVHRKSVVQNQFN